MSWERPHPQRGMLSTSSASFACIHCHEQSISSIKSAIHNSPLLLGHCHWQFSHQLAFKVKKGRSAAYTAAMRRCRAVGVQLPGSCSKRLRVGALLRCTGVGPPAACFRAFARRCPAQMAAQCTAASNEPQPSKWTSSPADSASGWALSLLIAASKNWSHLLLKLRY